MISISTEQGVALYLHKENAEERNYLPELESLLGRAVISCNTWADILNVAEQQAVSILVFELGIESTVAELEKLKSFSGIQPDSIRVGLFSPNSLFNRSAYGNYCHRLMSNKAEVAAFRLAIQEAARARRVLSQDKLSQFVDGITQTPSYPEISSRLVDTLSEPVPNVRKLAQALNEEPEISRQLIDQVNTACFILQKNISNVLDAVNIIGARQSHYMVLADQIFDQFPQSSSWKSFAFDHIRERSLLVAGLTQDICQSVKAPAEIADQAFVASLLQGLGLLIFASNFSDSYQKVMQEASDLKQPLYVVEKLRMRVSHSEVGAYLLSKWDLPPAAVEAVLFHHFPTSSKCDDFTALTALHVADAILPNVTNVLGCQISSRLNMAYLERLGLDGMVNQWQKIASGYKTSHPGCGGVVCSFA